MDKKIIAIDDDPDILEAIRIILEYEGYEIETVCDPTYAKQVILKHIPSLVLLDIWMPALDGTQLAKLLKDDIRTKNIPVIIISANTDLAWTANRVGAIGYISKPFDIKKLTSTVKKYIHKAN